MTTGIRNLCLAAMLLGGSVLTGAETPSSALPKPYPEHLRWWAEGRFGVFIHWGPVSLKETEISWSRANTNPKCPNHGEIPAAEYDALYKRFNPVQFNGNRWADLIKGGGAKYMVLTAKHCDGFLLWPSRMSDYNISATPFQRDICAELSAAARSHGLRMGWYFSPMDWRDPDFRTERNGAFLGRMQGEVRELLGNYGKIDLLWFDYDGMEPEYSQAATYRIVKELQPRIVINNRLDLGPKSSNREILSTNADYSTPEQSVGAYEDQRPWESCMTLSARDQWAWGGTKDGVKSFETCLDMLVRCAGGDGNLLLNVGPTPTGEIAPEQAARLKELGAWLSVHGESIYGTRGGPFKPGGYGVSTRNGRTIYLHIRNGAAEVLQLPAIPAKVRRNHILGGGRAEVRQTAAGLEVTVPERYRSKLDTVVALELDVEALSIPALAVPGEVSLSTGAKATASNVYQANPNFGADKAADGNDETRWATDAGTTNAWLEMDFGKRVTVGRAVIRQAFPELHRIRKFSIEYWQDGVWKKCHEGENPGGRTSVKFTPVETQRMRLSLTECTDGPTLWEFSLHPPVTGGGSTH